MKNKSESIINKLVFFLVFVSAVLYFLFSFFKSVDPYDFDYKKYKSNIARLIDRTANQEITLEVPYSIDRSDAAILKASSYVIYDITNSKVISGYNENIQQPLASLSKLMTAYVATLECKDVLKTELDTLLVSSNNDAANRIANNCPNYDDFIKIMNISSVKNKLELSFTNPSGLDLETGKSNSASNFGNAVSVARLMGILYEKNGALLRHTTKDSFNALKNTNEYAERFPFLIASKTGYTDIAGGNLATLYEVTPGHIVAVVVLGSSREDRFSDTFLLLRSYLKNVK